MSETTTSGVGVAAVAGCTAVMGAVADAGHAIYRGLTWLSEEGQREMARLERSLSPLPSHVTTREARENFKKTYAHLTAQIGNNTLLNGHVNAVARILSLKHSMIGAFMSREEWACLSQPAVTHRSFHRLFDLAARRFTESNTRALSKSIAEVAADVGFVGQRVCQKMRGKMTLVMEDSQGRALIADIIDGEDGAKVCLDLTGFGDGSCHPVMDRILRGLAEKQIHLEDVERRSHYRREGMTDSALQYTKPKRSQLSQSSGSRTLEADRRRKQLTRPTAMKHPLRVR